VKASCFCEKNEVSDKQSCSCLQEVTISLISWGRIEVDKKLAEPTKEHGSPQIASYRQYSPQWTINFILVT